MKLNMYSLSNVKEILGEFRINMMLTERCNNKCWYCGTNSHLVGENYEEFDDYKMDKLFDFIYAQKPERIERIVISIIGGEPTLVKKFPLYLERFLSAEKVAAVDVSTNLQTPTSCFQDMPANKKLSFICSFHSDWVNNVDKWFQKVEILDKKGILEKVLLLLTSKNINKIKKVYEKYKGIEQLRVHAINEFRCENQYKKLIETGFFKKFDMHVNAIEDLNGEISSDNISVILEDGSNDYKNYDKYNCFKGMFCNGGFIILANGDVKHCDNSARPLTNICKESKRLREWYVCEGDECIIGLDFQKLSARYLSKFLKGELKL